MEQALDNEAGLVRRPWRVKAAGALLLFAACAGAYWFGSQNATPPVANGGLIIDDKHLDLGTVWEDGAFAWKVPIRNAGDRDVTIHDFVTSCTCVGIEPRAMTLAPGESREVSVKLDLRRAPKGHESAWQWAFEAAIAPKIDTETVQQKGWLIQGHVRKLLQVSPPVLSFRDDLVRGQPFAERKATILSAVPLDDLRADCDTSKGSIAIQRRSATEFELIMRPAATLAAGPFKANISLQPRAAESPHLPRKSLRAEGMVHEQVEAIPSPIMIGARPLGEKVFKTVRLVSRTNQPFTLQGWTVQSTSRASHGANIIVRRVSASTLALEIDIAGSAGSAHTQHILLDIACGAPMRALTLSLPIAYLVLAKEP